MTSRRTSHFIFLAAFAILMALIHLPLLALPFHWDELGQFIPAALDLFRDGAWVTHSASPNIHPPGVMAILAGVWKLTGYSILSTRITMLAIAVVGVYLSFLLAIRLSRETWGAPAFPAVLFLMAAPMVYTQSVMALLDLPAMTFTVLALLLFLNGRFALCAIACTALVLIKETAITTPFVFAVWLWFRQQKRREAFYFLTPAIALGLWLIVLRQSTGSWFGNESFAAYNVADSLKPVHILYAIFRRAYTLFFADGHWIGAFALYIGSRVLKGPEWQIAFWVAAAQVAVVTFFGGAVLDRYLLPILPIFYAAVAAAATVYPRRRRILSHGAMLLLLVAGIFWNPPYPFPLENNLAVVDFVRLQETGAQYLEERAPDARIATAWPFSAALRQPEFGYIHRRLRVQRAENLRQADLRALDLSQVDIIAMYSRGNSPSSQWLRSFLSRYVEVNPEATPGQLRELGFVSLIRWDRRGQWMELYRRATLGE